MSCSNLALREIYFRRRCLWYADIVIRLSSARQADGFYQIYELRQSKLIAHAFMTLGESHVGLAGHSCTQGSTDQTRYTRLAETHIERSREGWSITFSFQYFRIITNERGAVYGSLEDRSGMLQCLVMQSQLAKWREGEGSVAHADALYMSLLADNSTVG